MSGQWIDRLVRMVVGSPRGVVVIVTLISLLAGFGLSRGITLDASPFSFIEREGQPMIDYRRTRQHFGSDDFLIAAVVAEEIFTPANLGKLRRLHQQIAGLRGVEEILSLANVPYARRMADGASLETLLPTSLVEGARLTEAREQALSDRLYVGQIVSPDGRMAALNILLDSDLSTPERHAVTARIYDLTKSAGFSESYFAGDPFSQWRAVAAIQQDLRLFLPLTVLLLIVLLWRSFRSGLAVLLPLGTIGIGLLWLLGLMAALQARFTILALMLPTVMLAIGCSYMIHVVNQIGLVAAAKRETGSARAAIIEEAVRFIALPVIVSALTIIAGFLSLSLTTIPAIRETAVYAAIGAAITMVLSLTFLPAGLLLLKHWPITFRIGLGGPTVGLLERIGHWATTHQLLLYAVTAAVVLISLVGTWRIVIDIDYFHFFKQRSETTIGLAEINRRLSGAVTFNLVIEEVEKGTRRSPDGLTSPADLRRLQQLQRIAEAYRNEEGRGIDRTLSVVDFLAHAHRAFGDGDHLERSGQEQPLPDDPAIIRELLAEQSVVRGFVSDDRRLARILVRSNLSGSQSMARAIETLEAKGKELFPERRVYATGTMVLLNRTSDRIAGEQRLSIGLALVTIFGMLSLLFRSLRVGLTALVPNLIPILFFFGFMGWAGIPLNLTTSLVASVVLGLAVDNAIQFIIRFRRLQGQKETLTAAIIETMRLSGRPIIYANIALAATFAIFAVSQFEPIGSFGLLSAVTILGCLLEDLILLPARLTSPVFRIQ
ncbi:MAG: efflux RND transporter permease subunit [Blastocatellia bacterium]